MRSRRSARLPGADARGLREPLDRRLRERRQALRRVLGAGVRDSSVHAAQLHRHAGRRLHDGARDGALDAHHPVARDAAVHLFGLHDLRRRGAVDAERGAAARVHARALDGSDRADRAAAARDRQHHRHVLHAGDVRRLRAARAPAGRAGPADHGRDPDRDLHAAAEGLLRRRDRHEPFTGITWARIPHFFNSPYYVYQYATCFASAAKIAQADHGRRHGRRARRASASSTLLRSGGSDYPMELLRKAGVDLSQPDTVSAVVDQLDGLVTRLERELERQA